MQQPASRSQQHIRDIMTTPVHSVDMDDSLLTVKRLFERERCHHVVIMERDKAHGVVSDRDILKVVSPFVGSKTMERSQDLNTLQKRVHQIMSRNLVTTTPDETIAAAAEQILRERVSCLPVVDDQGAAVGIVTLRDFVAWAVVHADVKETRLGEPKQDDGVLIIIDGKRCYSPDAETARLVRDADRLSSVKNGPE